MTEPQHSEPTTASSPRASLVEALSGIPTITAAMSFGMLCMAFVHEWAYFGVVGRQFQSLMSPSDYVSSAIGWVPTLAIGGLIVFVNEAFTQRLEGFRSRAVLATHYKTPRRAWWALEAPYVILGWQMIIFGALVFVFLNVYDFGMAVGIALSIIWFWGFGWFLAHERVAPYFTYGRGLLLTFVPYILLYAYFMGLESGTRALGKFERAYVVKLKNDEAEKNLQVLRTLGAGLIVRDALKSRVTFLKWDEVSAVSLRVESPDKRSYFCWLTGRGCFDIPVAPEP